jgi:tRNA(Ile)-lysidine synthase TilS/MesJ
MTIKSVSNALMLIKLLFVSMLFCFLGNLLKTKTQQELVVSKNNVTEQNNTQDDLDSCNCTLESTIQTYYKDENKTIKELCTEYDVDWTTIQNWINDYGTPELKKACKHLERDKITKLAHENFGKPTSEYKSMFKCELIEYIKEKHIIKDVTNRHLTPILEEIPEIKKLKGRCRKLTPKQIEYVLYRL